MFVHILYEEKNNYYLKPPYSRTLYQNEENVKENSKENVFLNCVKQFFIHMVFTSDNTILNTNTIIYTLLSRIIKTYFSYKSKFCKNVGLFCKAATGALLFSRKTIHRILGATPLAQR